MKFHILVGQRKCTYPGQYAMEALEIADEWMMEENGVWLAGKKEYYEQSKEFDALAVMVVFVHDDFVKEALYPPEQPPVDGEVVK